MKLMARNKHSDSPIESCWSFHLLSKWLRRTYRLETGGQPCAGGQTISIDVFASADVTTRGENNFDITIINAERGVIDTGEGEDQLTIITDPLIGDGGNDETFVVNTDGGDDVITLATGSLENSDFRINGGESMDGTDSILDYRYLQNR